MSTLEEKIHLINFDQEDEKLMEVIQRALDGYNLTQSLIQRLFRIGYSRSGRILERLVELEILMSEEVATESKLGTDETLLVTTKTQYKISDI